MPLHEEQEQILELHCPGLATVHSMSSKAVDTGNTVAAVHMRPVDQLMKSPEVLIMTWRSC
jgi:hypothetical protein